VTRPPQEEDDFFPLIAGRSQILRTIGRRIDAYWAEIQSIAPHLAKRDVLDAAEHILWCAEYDPAGASGKTAKQLEQFAAKANGVIMAINALDPSLQWRLGAEALVEELRRAIDASVMHVPRAVTQSGGSRKAREDRVMKEVAANLALEMLWPDGASRPPLTAGGKWITLTEILYEVATGRECGGAYRACRAVRGD
jgi:hypothetical protein